MSSMMPLPGEHLTDPPERGVKKMAARRDRAQTGKRFWLSSGLADHRRTRRRRDALHAPGRR
jgi:hypothetical protein